MRVIQKIKQILGKKNQKIFLEQFSMNVNCAFFGISL